ncbi:hypothetical protein [Methanobacterium sp. ACI-7]|uniref:hypothetical protein n=1 Tax=unclassified Methanobacterium TaxID=2627676 RepID=UPI0039C2B902
MKKIIIILLLIAFLTPITVYAQGESPESSSAIAQGYNPEYNILPIILSIIMFYLITYLIYDNKTIKRRTYKQIWSIVLVISFLFVGISGIILSILADYNLVLPVNFNLLFWHVEFGIILAITIFLHIHIHWKAFPKVLKGNWTSDSD